ncbi:hypothetical protein, partial [Escherichia coli]
GNINQEGNPKQFPVINERLKTATTNDFKKIPGSPIAYWISHSLLNVFETSKPISEYFDTRLGMSTANNDEFLRFWHEVSIQNIGFGCKDREEASN